MRKNVKGIQLEAKRINDIFSYVTSLNSPICNVNCKNIAIANPIMIASAYETLLQLKKEVAGLSIDIQEIDVDRIFKRQYANETERFIAGMNTGTDVAYLKADYLKMIEMESLESVYPYNDRIERKHFLEQQIDKRLQAQVKIEKVAPQLAKNQNREIDDMRRELQGLLDSLNVVTREELQVELYANAQRFIEHLKLMIDTKIEYIENLLQEI